jgi:orotidine-5'-phosphate decarboxylase
MIPSFIKDACFAEFGKNPEGAAEAVLRFNKGIMDALAGIVPAVKPQIAFYEALGPAGVRVYAKTISYAKEAGFAVIGDVKRGDIASTAEAYSAGHIGSVEIAGLSYAPFDSDFITVSPYMGFDSIEPYIPDCRKYGKGIFVLVKTSNPGGVDIQDLSVNGRPVYEIVGNAVEEIGSRIMGANGYGAVGAVVGATMPEQAKRLRKIMPKTFFLVPGYGAQGGGAREAAAAFDENGGGALVNSSRGIIAAYKTAGYKERFAEKDYALAARQAAIDMRGDLKTYIQ